MSTREMAHKILDNLSEDQLEGFISLFGVFDAAPKVTNISEKEKAYTELCHMIKPLPEIDYDKELAEYREEKYGI